MRNIGVDEMVEVGIPVYKARDTLPAALDSLVSQTKKTFIVCLSIDGDGEDYSDIIKTYQQRGLKMRVIKSEENKGPGAARQAVLDTTMCDYIMFLDADDMFMPRAIEVLYQNIRLKNYDILRGSFIREQSNKDDLLLSASSNVITWFHGKIYKVKYLKDNNIRFLEWLRTDEDAYFNAVAWNSTKNKGVIEEVMYIWRDNKNSITRGPSRKEYFSNTYFNYICGQVEALKRIAQLNSDIDQMLITNTLINIYYYYMKARFYHLDEKIIDDSLSTLRDEEWAQKWINNGQNWIAIANNLKAAQVIDDSFVAFYNETFNIWANRLIRKV